MIFLFSIRHQTDSQTASDKGKREKKGSLLSTTHLSKQQEDDSDLLAAQRKGASPHLLPSGLLLPLPLQSDAVSVRLRMQSQAGQHALSRTTLSQHIRVSAFFNIIFWELAQEVPKSRP